MGIFCLALAMMCGTLGYTGCAVIVRRIYRNIKVRAGGHMTR